MNPMAASKTTDKVTWDQVWSEARTVDEKLDLLARAVGDSNPDAKSLKDWADNQHQVPEPGDNPADADAKTE